MKIKLSAVSHYSTKSFGYIFIMLFFFLVTSGFTKSNPNNLNDLEKCLDKDPQETHSCYLKSKSTKNKKSQEDCFEQSEKIKSDFLRENFRLYCFYEISDFKDYSSCVGQAQKFLDTESHDAALFDCYLKNQTKMTIKTCNELVKKFKIPEKGTYLKVNQCDMLDL